MGDRGPIQLDIGIVVSNLGANSSSDRDNFNGLFSFFGIDFGLYIGPSYNLFQTIGPSIGAGLLIGSNGFLAGKVGIHFKRAFGLAILFPIVPIYGAGAANFLSALPIPEEIKTAAAVPVLIVPAAFAYKTEIEGLHRSGMRALKDAGSYIHGKLGHRK